MTQTAFFIAALGSLSFAVAAGMLSPWILLRRESFLGDVTAHATLAGIVALLLLPASPFPFIHSPVGLLLGGLLAATLAHELAAFLRKHTPLKEDMILASILSLSAATALVLLTRLVSRPQAVLLETGGLANGTLGTIGKTPGELAALMRRFLLGQPAAMLESEAYTLAGIALIILIVMSVTYRQWLLLTFSTEWAKTLGFPSQLAQRGFRLLLIALILAGILSVGALMVSALIVAPGVIARTLHTKMKPILAISMTASFSFMLIALILGNTQSGFPEAPVAVGLSTVTAIILLFITRK